MTKRLCKMALAAVILVIVGMFAVSSFTTSRAKADDLNNLGGVELSEEASDPLAGKTVYMYNAYQGVALNEANAASLVQQSEESGVVYSSFYDLATAGETLEDAETGARFVVQSGSGGLELGDGAEIYIIDGCSLDVLTSGSLTIDDFVFVGHTESSYGDFDLYDMV